MFSLVLVIILVGFALLYRLFIILVNARGCVFCKIVGKKLKTEICLEDDHFVIFKDIGPVSAQHFLVIPKSHDFADVNQVMNAEGGASLLKSLRNTAKRFVEKNHPNLQFIFRMSKPPFNTVFHLHLHAIALPMNGSLKSKFLSSNISSIDIENAIQRAK